MHIVRLNSKFVIEFLWEMFKSMMCAPWLCCDLSFQSKAVRFFVSDLPWSMLRRFIVMLRIRLPETQNSLQPRWPRTTLWTFAYSFFTPLPNCQCAFESQFCLRFSFPQSHKFSAKFGLSTGLDWPWSSCRHRCICKVGPWGSSHTRWEMEAWREFTIEGCVEVE